jgi:hypothetical protein
MSNPVIRHESCHNCGRDFEIREYSYMNHSQLIPVATDNGKVQIGECCWNKLVNRTIDWTDKGWTLVPEILHGAAQFEDAAKNGGRR